MSTTAEPVSDPEELSLLHVKELVHVREQATAGALRDVAAKKVAAAEADDRLLERHFIRTFPDMAYGHTHTESDTE